ncbi:MAG: hypothetical protein OXI96_01770 [Acidimicrobiaceae bacterium]|nr:hypothetical protein [Acidimicrobiaceae bacterium]
MILDCATGELGYVDVEMLATDVVVHAVIRPLEHSPEALNAVGVCHTSHVFSHAVVHDNAIIAVSRRSFHPSSTTRPARRERL